MIPNYTTMNNAFKAQGCEGLVNLQLNYYETNKGDKDIVAEMITLGFSAATILSYQKMCALENEIREMKIRMTGAP